MVRGIGPLDEIQGPQEPEAPDITHKLEFPDKLQPSQKMPTSQLDALIQATIFTEIHEQLKRRS